MNRYSRHWKASSGYPAMNERLEQRFFLLLLGLVSLLFLWLLKPFFAPLLWACIIAILFHPVQVWLNQRWGSRPTLTALATLLACMVLVVLPILFLIYQFLQEGVNLYNRIQTGEIDPAEFLERIRNGFPIVQSLFERFDLNLESIWEQAASAAVGASRFLATNAFALGQSTFEFVLKLGLMLYVAFFLLRDGRRLTEHLIATLPLGDERERLLFQKFAEVMRATVKGNLVVAIVQGALGGIIFWILGIPGALLWGVIMAVLSLIPAIGAGLVWLPAAIYLIAVGDWIAGVVLIVYGVVVIGLADNILRPILVGRDTKLPDWLVLLSTLGGIVLIGISGFVVGPLIAALFIASWQIFRTEFYQDQSAEQADQPVRGPDRPD